MWFQFKVGFCLLNIDHVKFPIVKLLNYHSLKIHTQNSPGFDASNHFGYNSDIIINACNLTNKMKL